VFFGPSGTVFPEPGIKLALPFDDSAVSTDVKNALGDGSMEFKVHKLVDGVFVPHPFPPVLVVDPVTGIKTMTVKTLGFSAYMTLIVPAARTTPVSVPNVTAQIVPRAPTPPPLRPAVAPVIPTPAPGPKPQSNIPAIVGGSIGGVIFLCCLGTGIYVFRARQGAQLQGSKSKQYRGKLTESLLGGHVVTASDSSATPSTDTTPPGSTMWLTKAQQKALRPRTSEVASSLAVQGDLVMADGSNPPSYAASEIDREEVEERILAGGGALYPRPEMDSRPMLNADYVTIPADLMMADPFDSPGPSEYAPSLPPSDIDFDDDERAPAQVSFEFAKSLRSKMDGKGARSNGSGGYSTGPSAYNSDDDGPPSARSRKCVSIAPQWPVLEPTLSAPTTTSITPSSSSSATWTRQFAFQRQHVAALRQREHHAHAAVDEQADHASKVMLTVRDVMLTSDADEQSNACAGRGSGSTVINLDASMHGRRCQEKDFCAASRSVDVEDEILEQKLSFPLNKYST
jgi:hypothetical protein